MAPYGMAEQMLAPTRAHIGKFVHVYLYIYLSQTILARFLAPLVVIDFCLFLLIVVRTITT